MFFNVPPGNKDDAMMPNPLMEEENHCVHNCDDELRFSKVCEIFKVRSTESYMSICYCGDISTPLNMTQPKTKCDCLLYLSVIWPLWWASAIQSCQGSAVSLKVLLRKTRTVQALRVLMEAIYSINVFIIILNRIHTYSD